MHTYKSLRIRAKIWGEPLPTGTAIYRLHRAEYQSGAKQAGNRRLTTLSADLHLSRPDIELQDDLLTRILREGIKHRPYHPAAIDKEDGDPVK